MHAARGVQIREHADVSIARRQRGGGGGGHDGGGSHDGGGGGDSHNGGSDGHDHTSDNSQPPANGGSTTTPPPAPAPAPPPPPPAPAPVIPTTTNPPAGNLDGGGTITQTRTSGTNILPAASNSNQGPNANAGVANLGGGSSASNNGGLSSDLTLGTFTSSHNSTPSPTVPKTGTPNNPETNPSRAAIAAAVTIILLFLIALLVFFLRRRSKARRAKRAVQWGFTRNRNPQNYTDDFNFRNSNRSSLATAFDQSSMTILLPPPMAEVGRHNATSPSLVLDINAARRHISTGSAHSDNSQFLVVRHRESQYPDNWASVTECSEAFPFPKPPLVDSPSLHSGASEGYRALLQRREEHDMLDIASLGSSLPTPFPLPTPITQPILPPPPLNIDNDNGSTDLFDDPVPSYPPPIETSSDVQTVRRPFFAQLQDEMQVVIGDSVRVLKIFDDGWAVVEKVSHCTIGLIPIECLRDLVGPSISLGGNRTSSLVVELSGSRKSGAYYSP